MAKKSKRFAVRQSALSKRKKSKAGLSQRQKELSGSLAGSDSSKFAYGVNASTPTSSAKASDNPQALQENVINNTPWRYSYVVSDIKRIGMITGIVAILLLVLTFLLG